MELIVIGIYLLSLLINIIDVAGSALKWGIHWGDLFSSFIPIINSLVAVMIVWFWLAD